MANKHELLLALRNGINKLTGKQELIDEYERAVYIISHKLDKMNSGADKDKLSAELARITEESHAYDGEGGYNVGNFDQYKSNKKTLKQKIELTKKLMQQMEAKR